jgi:cation diffusion facilitator family transporter
MHEGSQRAIVAALLANAGIAAAKFVGAAITGSSAMLAEGIHSVADSGNQALLLLGGRQAKRGPSDEHPFGYGRARYFWAFVVALVLFSVGGLFAVYEGIAKLRHPHELTSPQVAIGILLIALALELVSLRVAVRESNKLRGSQSWWRFLRRSKNPELPVVVLEDLGALVGLVFALVGVGLTMITGEPRFDAAATLAIGVLLVTIAGFLASEMKSLLIGESASDEDLVRIQASLEDGPEVRGLIHMRTEHLGPDELLIGAKLEFDPSLSVAELAGAVDAAEARLREAVPAAAIVYIEPDLRRDAASTPPPGAAPAAG